MTRQRTGTAAPKNPTRRVRKFARKYTLELTESEFNVLRGVLLCHQYVEEWQRKTPMSKIIDRPETYETTQAKA